MKKPVVEKTLKFTECMRVGRKQAGYEVITTDKEYDQLWSELYEAPPKPRVNLTKFFLIGVFAGEKPTGGYTCEIDRLKLRGSCVQVFVRMLSPGPGDFVTMVFTFPGQLVRVPRRPLAGIQQPVVFRFADQEGRLLMEVEKQVH